MFPMCLLQDWSFTETAGLVFSQALLFILQGCPVPRAGRFPFSVWRIPSTWCICYALAMGALWLQLAAALRHIWWTCVSNSQCSVQSQKIHVCLVYTFIINAHVIWSVILVFFSPINYHGSYFYFKGLSLLLTKLLISLLRLSLSHLPFHFLLCSRFWHEPIMPPETWLT